MSYLRTKNNKQKEILSNFNIYSIFMRNICQETVFYKNRLKIYPNPTNNVVYFQTDLEINNIALYDVTGKVVFENNTSQIDLSTFPSGVSK